jgi:hypothetical protein
MGSHFAQKPKSRNNAVVQINELCFSKLVDVDLHGFAVKFWVLG